MFYLLTKAGFTRPWRDVLKYSRIAKSNGLQTYNQKEYTSDGNLNKAGYGTLVYLGLNIDNGLQLTQFYVNAGAFCLN